jgi:hypothetical protein
VTGAYLGTEYSFTVVAVTSQGPSVPSASSNGVSGREISRDVRLFSLHSALCARKSHNQYATSFAHYRSLPWVCLLCPS